METWRSNKRNNNDFYKLPEDSSIHQVRSSIKADGVLTIFVHNSLARRKNFNTANEDIEALCIEIFDPKSKNILNGTSLQRI